jgi:hypothetical protein
MKIEKGPLKGYSIEMAPQISVDQFEDIAVDFMLKIFGMEYADVLITDESSIYDFDEIEFPEDSNKPVKHNTGTCLQKIKEIYGLDVSDIKGLFLVKIFERIRILRP